MRDKLVLAGFTAMTAGITLALAGSPAWAAGRDLVIASSAVTHTLEPMAFNANVSERVSNNVLESLWDYDNATGKYKPMLAESWEVVDPQTIVAKIRQGVKCHDGQDFTAEDVEVSFGPKRLRGEDAPGWTVARSFLGTLDEVTATDRYTVRIHSKVADPIMVARLSGFMSEMVCKDAFLAAKSWEDWGRSVVGTGPYKLVSMKPNENIELAAFDDYWGTRAPVDGVTFKAVPELASRVAGLLTGEYDIISEIVPDQFKTLEDSGKAKVAGGPTANIRVLLYDKFNPALTDPRMRQALSYAIDRKLIDDSIFGGRARVPQGQQDPMFGDMFLKDYKTITYDPDKAKQLVAESGYKGEPINYRYMNDYYTGEVQTAQILQSMWKSVGINVQLEMKENWDQIISKNAAPGRGIYNSSGAMYWNDPVGHLWRLYQKGGLFQNSGSWEDADFDALGEKLLSTDLKTRQDAFAEMLKIYDYTDPPGTFLYYLPAFYGVKDGVNWKASKFGFMDLRAGNLSVDN